MGYLFWLWLLFILVMSSIPNLPVPKEKIIPLIRTDYLLHFIQYFILAFLLVFWRQQLLANLYQIALLIILGVFLSTIDELHQLVIPERTFNIKDVIANSLGFFFGFMFANWLMLIFSKDDQ